MTHISRSPRSEARVRSRAESAEIARAASRAVSTLPQPVLERRSVGKGSEDLRFAGADGSVLRNGNLRNRFIDPAAQRIRDRDTTFPHVTPHDLRHTAASLAVSSGAKVNAVQRMLGHASASMALDVYTDLVEDDLDRVALALDLRPTSQSSRARPLVTLRAPIRSSGDLVSVRCPRVTSGAAGRLSLALSRLARAQSVFKMGPAAGRGTQKNVGAKEKPPTGQGF